MIQPGTPLRVKGSTVHDYTGMTDIIRPQETGKGNELTEISDRVWEDTQLPHYHLTLVKIGPLPFSLGYKNLRARTVLSLHF